MYPTLTKKQKIILDFLKVYTQLNGYAPSLIEIKNHFQLSAVSTVHEHLQHLKAKGFIQKELNQARSIRPVNLDPTMSQLTEIPIIGQLKGFEVQELSATTNQEKILYLHNNQTKKLHNPFAVLVQEKSYQCFFIFNEFTKAETGQIIVGGQGKRKIHLGVFQENKNGITQLRSYQNEKEQKQLENFQVQAVLSIKFEIYP